MKRDFTINAIYYDLEKELLIDPTKGLQDLANKMIVVAGISCKDTFQDNVRVLRVLRQAG